MRLLTMTKNVMAIGDIVTVVFYNVRVRALGAGDLVGGEISGARKPDPVDDMLIISDTVVRPCHRFLRLLFR